MTACRRSTNRLLAIALLPYLAGCAALDANVAPDPKTRESRPDRLVAFRDFRDCRDRHLAADEFEFGPVEATADRVMLACSWELARLSDALGMDAEGAAQVVRPEVVDAIEARQDHAVPLPPRDPDDRSRPVDAENLQALSNAASLCLDAGAAELDDGFSGARAVGEAVARRCLGLIEELAGAADTELSLVYGDAIQEATLMVLEHRAERRALENDPLFADPSRPEEEEV